MRRRAICRALRLAPDERLEGTDPDGLIYRLGLFGCLDLADRISSANRSGKGDRANIGVRVDPVDREGSPDCSGSADRSSSPVDTDFADRVGRADKVGEPDRGGRVDFVEVVRGAGLYDCGMLTCGFHLAVSVE